MQPLSRGRRLHKDNHYRFQPQGVGSPFLGILDHFESGMQVHQQTNTTLQGPNRNKSACLSVGKYGCQPRHKP